MVERLSFISKLILYVGISLIFITVLFVMYYPVLQKDFYYQDDYILFKPAGEPAAVRDDIIKSDGRLLNGIMAFYLWSHARSSNSVKIMRFIAVIGMTLFASVMWAIFKQFRVRSDHAFLMSLLICTLPSSQMYMLSTQYSIFIYGALLASLSALVLFQVILKEYSSWRISEIIGVITAIILLVTSFTLYQPGSMMYWVVGVIFCITGDTHDFFKKYRRPLIIYFFIGVISIAIYFIVFIKIAPFIMNYSSTRESLVAIHNIPLKLVKFIVIPLNNAMNLWNIYPSYIFAVFVSMIIFSEIIIGKLQMLKEKKQFYLRNYSQKYSVILCLLILCYLPSLVVAEYAYTYRTLIALGSALSILFCFGLMHIVEFSGLKPNISSGSRKLIISVLLTGIVIVTAYQARHNAMHWTWGFELDVKLWERWGIQ